MINPINETQNNFWVLFKYQREERGQWAMYLFVLAGILLASPCLADDENITFPTDLDTQSVNTEIDNISPLSEVTGNNGFTR